MVICFLLGIGLIVFGMSSIGDNPILGLFIAGLGCGFLSIM